MIMYPAMRESANRIAAVFGILIILAVRDLRAQCPRPTAPATRAVRSCYAETSSHADVIAFIDSMQVMGIGFHAGEIGRSTEGRSIPYLVLSRPLVRTASEARRLGRPIVYVQGNIHGGEVEGKEALLALVRDLSRESKRNVLDSIVLIAVPIYNADGNDKFGPQRTQRGSQQGPELVGLRANGQGLDLNRDYLKAEAPETRGALTLFRELDPDVFVDLHTTNGSYHGYQLTYSASLHPAAAMRGASFGGAWAMDSLLPAVRRRVKARHRIETFHYGNFAVDESPAPGRDRRATLLDTVKRGWVSYDHRPRFGSNYYGLRGRIGILSEAYSHDPFATRVRATNAFVRELLHEIAARAPRIIALSRQSDIAISGWPPPTVSSRRAPEVPIRSALTSRRPLLPILVERLEATGDSSRTEAGVPPGIRRTGRIVAVRMPVAARFDPTLHRAPPAAYALHAADSAAVALLRLHGIVVERLTAPAFAATAESFIVDSIARAERPFQGHREVTLGGRWEHGSVQLAEGDFVVPVAQRLGVLAMILLEPESDDGLTTWNVFDAALRRGESHPVRRILGPITGARRAIP